MNKVNTYTAWCQQASGEGTIWIGPVEATPGTSLDSIRLKAIRNCAIDWSWDLEAADNIHCLGIARGNVDMVFWSDLGQEDGPMHGGTMEDAP